LKITSCPAEGSGAVRLPDGRRLAFHEITAVYWRSYHGVAPVELPDPEQAYIAENDARGLFESLLVNLPARWVNGWRAFQLHQTKPVQLAMVAALGVPVPATLVANDPESVREFAGQHAPCIFKPVQGGAHARRLTPSHLSDENLRNLALSPVTVQQEVAGTDVRVFVAGRRVLACEIRTEQVDFRDEPDPPIESIELPPQVHEQCLNVARTLELLWTGIDLRRTPQGQFVFLEANPSPMFLGFEERTGLPLGESLAALLLQNE
jgi:glutathione synthase/RimK-type ligase-like ATP-grasp enzyme